MTGAAAGQDPDPVDARFLVHGRLLALNGFILGLCWLSGHVSIGWLLTLAEPKNQWRLHLYVLGWFAALCLILALTPQSGGFAIILTALAFYRLQDLLFASIGDALGVEYARFNWRGRLIILLFNIAEIVIIFAIADYVLLASQADHRFDALFMSWTDFPPLGGGSIASTVGQRLLVMAETATGFLMVVLALSAFLSRSGPPAGATAAAGRKPRIEP